MTIEEGKEADDDHVFELETEEAKSSPQDENTVGCCQLLSAFCRWWWCFPCCCLSFVLHQFVYLHKQWFCVYCRCFPATDAPVADMHYTGVSSGVSSSRQYAAAASESRRRPNGVPYYSMVFFIVCFSVGMAALAASLGYKPDTSSRLTRVDYISRSCRCKSKCPHNTFGICRNECENVFGHYDSSLHYSCVETRPEFTFSDGFRCTIQPDLVIRVSHSHTPYPTQCAYDATTGESCESYDNSRQWWQSRLDNHTDFVQHLYRHSGRHVCITRDKIDSGIITGSLLLTLSGFFMFYPLAYFCT